MRDDVQDWEITDGQLSQFANLADDVEKIASNAVNSNNLPDDDVFADPIPIIPKSMQSTFSQVKVSSQNFQSWADDKRGANYEAQNEESYHENFIKKPTVVEQTFELLKAPEEVSESSEPASLVQSTTAVDVLKWEDDPESEAVPKPDTRNVFQTMADASIDLAQSGAKAAATNWNDAPSSEYVPKADTRNVF